MYFDKQGNKIDLLQWAAMHERFDNRRLRSTRLRGPARGTKRVSTVWLGLDHSFGGDTPLIFESMVFNQGSYEDLACRRYPTDQDAIEGHISLCGIWQYNRATRRKHGLA